MSKLFPSLPCRLFIIMPVKCIQEPNVAMLMTVCEFCIGGSLEAIQDCIVPLQSSIRLTPQQRLDSFNFKDSARMKNSLVLYMFLHGGSLITLLQARQALYRDLKVGVGSCMLAPSSPTYLVPAPKLLSAPAVKMLPCHAFEVYT